MIDVLIIGAGPIGIACGLAAKKKGLSSIIIEKGTLVNSLYNYPVSMTFFSTSEKLEINEIPFISNNSKPTKQEALEYYRRVAKSNSLKINLYEEVQSVKKEKHFKVTTSASDYEAKNVVIATGFYDLPNLLNVDGESLPKVKHYYGDPHEYAFIKTIIVGASNSAVDAALEIYRKGGDVAMVVRKEAIGEGVKYWVKPDIENRIKEGSISAFFNSEITNIGPKEVKIDTPEGERKLENDFVLALTGYQPNLDFLEKIGISVNHKEHKKPIYNPNTMETNVEGVYLAGVICGGMKTSEWFIENSQIHAEKIINHIVPKG